jgi:hypothetical protein
MNISVGRKVNYKLKSIENNIELCLYQNRF